MKKIDEITLKFILGVVLIVFLVILGVLPSRLYIEEPAIVDEVTAVSPTPIIVNVECSCDCEKDEIVIEPELRYNFTDEDIYLLAQLLCGDGKKDGDGEYDFDYQEELNYYEISKVLCVVMNRIRDDKFPDTIEKVVLADKQFIVFPKNLTAEPSEKAIDYISEWCNAYANFDDGLQCIPEDHLYMSGNGVINRTSTTWFR